MMTTRTMSIAVDDAELVGASLAGDRDAFGQIVARYQSLVCSLAYSATGNLGQSEDLAQETFVAAWKQLAGLREPEKLRAWLCGIARNLINNSLRKAGREPSHQAESLEEISGSPSPEPLPVEQTISNEEQAILWRSLEQIPEIYREPLVLFYREHQSVEAVAKNLELSEDTVKQRLSRGRKILHEQVLAFVEGALEKSNPGRVFTLGVLAALPVLTISAKAATLGAAAAKGSASAKAAGALGMFGAILSPLVVIYGNYASYRMSMDEAHTDEERRHVKRLFRNALLITLALSAVLAAPLYWAFRNSNSLPLFCSLAFCQAIVIYFLTIAFFGFKSLAGRRRYLAAILTKEYGGKFPPATYEYRSRWSLLGLPLVHVRFGDRFDVVRGPVKGWIAIGSSHSVGAIFAYGGVAIAPVCFGGIAIGLLPFGAIALGLVSLGAISLGGWSLGALAVGWQADAGCAIAWNAALGGIAFAHDFAMGGIVQAAQANTETATQFIRQSWFFCGAQFIGKYYLWLIPLILQSLAFRRSRRSQKN